MSEVITAGGSQLAITAEQAFWTDQQLAALRQLGVDANSQGDLAVFFHQAQRSGLDPFKREIYMITRKGKPTIQTGIDGFYKIADRVSRTTGGTWGISETLWCGQDGQWADVWLQATPPAAAKVTIERNGSRFTVVALTSEYQAQGPMWQKMPARMIAKCAEALAIRKAFPEDLSGLYTSEEMAQADNTVRANRPSVSVDPAVTTSNNNTADDDTLALLADTTTPEEMTQLWDTLTPEQQGKHQAAFHAHAQDLAKND